MDLGDRAKHDSREGGGRAKQVARAEETRAKHGYDRLSGNSG